MPQILVCQGCGFRESENYFDLDGETDEFICICGDRNVALEKATNLCVYCHEAFVIKPGDFCTDCARFEPEVEPGPVEITEFAVSLEIIIRPKGMSREVYISDPCGGGSFALFV